jgi:MFS family permease
MMESRLLSRVPDQPVEPVASERGEERFASGYAGRLFFVVSAGWFGVAIGRQILPPLLPEIMAGLRITPFQAGTALTLMWGTYALIHYPGGRFADRLSRKTVLIGGTATLAVGFSLLSVAVVYPLFLLAVVVVGAGAGLYYISMRTTTADLYVAKRGQAFGIQSAAGQAGSASAAGIAILVLAVATWRTMFLPMVLFVAVVGVILHRLGREPYVLERVDLGVRETGHRVLGTALVRRVLLVYVLYNFSLQGAIGFLPTFLRAEKGFSPGLAGGSFAVVFIVGIVVGPVAGFVGDRYRKPLVVASAFALMAGGLAGVVWFGSVPAVGLSILVLSLGVWTYPPVMQAFLMDTFEDESMGGDFGGFKTIYSGIGSLGPSVIGFLAGWVGYTVAYASLAVCLLVGLTVLVSMIVFGP